MNKFKLFIFMVVFYLPAQFFLFAGEGKDVVKEFAFKDEGIIIISLENYKKKDGYTPVTLFVNGLSASYRLDESGRVTSRYDDSHSSGMFTLDKDESKLIFNNKVYPLTRYEDNAVRTRFRLETAAIPLKLRLNRETNQGEILFGTEKKVFAGFDIMLKANPAGYEELILPGRCHDDLAYHAAAGTITRVYKKDKLGNIRRGEAWAQRVGSGVVKEGQNEK